ncbi:MAG: hypothetical protein LC774_06870 [Acidobacteria bacterium]|nr:hypothetical protein [Acidobacteriota bacterium]
MTRRIGSVCPAARSGAAACAAARGFTEIATARLARVVWAREVCALKLRERTSVAATRALSFMAWVSSGGRVALSASCSDEF